MEAGTGNIGGNRKRGSRERIRGREEAEGDTDERTDRKKEKNTVSR